MPPLKRALRLCLAAALLLQALPLCACGARESAPLKRFEGGFLDVFDTATRVVLYAANEETAQAQMDLLHEELLLYHRLFDIYHSYAGLSNLRTVNENAGAAPVKVDARLIGLIRYCKEMYALTGGKTNVAMGSVLSLWHDFREAGLNDPASAALPPWGELAAAAQRTDVNDVIIDENAGTLFLAKPGMLLDVGAVAKGYAAQRAVEFMAGQGVSSMLLSLGGNVCALGSRADGQPWKVEVQAPDGPGALCAVAVSGQSLVTSGSYQRFYTVNGVRYHHIIDPQTLMPGTLYQSVSVLSNDSAMADALSTALFLLPLEEGMALVASLENTEALWVDADGNQTQSAGFGAYVLE